MYYYTFTPHVYNILYIYIHVIQIINIITSTFIDFHKTLKRINNYKGTYF